MVSEEQVVTWMEGGVVLFLVGMPVLVLYTTVLHFADSFRTAIPLTIIILFMVLFIPYFIGVVSRGVRERW